MKQKLSPKLISLTFSILVICFAIGFYVFAWIDPSAAPPGGNVDAPVNVGSTAQTKTGNLTLPNLYLNATANEGNIYNINNLIGYNDIYVKGNSSETAPVYIGGNLIKLYTSGLERVSIGLTGVVAVTNNLTVAGQSVCRQDGTNCPAESGGDITGVTAGTCLTGGGVSGNVTINADDTCLQRRVTSTCAAGSSIRVINSNGTVTCEPDTDTDTKCDSSGNCSQVCIGSSCRTTWPNQGLETHPISCWAKRCDFCVNAICAASCYSGFAVTSWSCSSGQKTVSGSSASCNSYSSTASGSGTCTKVNP